VKDFTVYLNYLKKFGLLEYVFPGMTINDRISKCFGPNPLVLYFANLFKNEESEGLQERLVQGCFIPIEVSRVVAFLIWFQEFTPDRITEFYSKKNSYRIDDEIIKEWISLAGLSGEEFEAFVKYRPTTSSQDLMAKGFKGKELGDQIKRLEIENFKRMI
jgi:hypothetical protein